MGRVSRTERVLLAVAVVLVAAAVTVAAIVLARDADRSAAPTPSTSARTTSSPTPVPAPSPTPTPAGDAWTLEQKVGQLFMVGVDVTEPDPVSRRAIVQDHVGNLFLHGRSTAGADDVRTLVERYTALVAPTTTHDEPMLVATDQEGGRVQVLRGPGFSDIPAATEQATWDPADLREQATAWGASSQRRAST